MKINVWTVLGNKWNETESLTREVARTVRNSEKQKSANKRRIRQVSNQMIFVGDLIVRQIIFWLYIPS